jgi:tryptophan synthase alpha chain
MSRIRQRFDALKSQGRTGLIPYIAAGDPSPALTVPLMKALAKCGADIVELGVPFSDPMADGPVIQRAAERAIAQGVGLEQCLAFAMEFRRTDADTPVVLMGYANPIERMGVDRFVESARASGVDGVLVVDYPPEECGEFARKLRGQGIDPIFLLAPTSTQKRIDEIAKIASGYVYYVSLTGITGAGHLDIGAVAEKLPAIRARTGLPIGVGFGIKDAQTAASIGLHADAVVIGSRVIQAMESAGASGAIDAATDFVAAVRAALDAPSKASGQKGAGG